MSQCPTPAKQEFLTYAEAARAAGAVKRKRDLSPDVRPYQCKCGRYHYGHSQESLDYRIRQARRAGRA